MPQETYRGALKSTGIPSHALAAQGSTVFVVNSDAATATGALDPWGVLSGDVTAHANVYPVGTASQYLYLDLFHMWPDNAAASGAVTVRVYGEVDVKMEGNARIWPGDVDTTNFEIPVNEDNQPSFWIPLPDKDGTHALALDTTASTIYADEVTLGNSSSSSGAAQPFAVGLPTSVYLAGVRRVMVLVGSASTEANSIVLGRFSG